MRKYSCVLSLMMALLILVTGLPAAGLAESEARLSIDLKGMNLTESQSWRSVPLHGAFDVTDAQGNYLGTATSNPTAEQIAQGLNEEITVPAGTLTLTPRAAALPEGYAFESSYTFEAEQGVNRAQILVYRAEGMLAVKHVYEDGTAARGGQFTLTDAAGNQRALLVTDDMGYAVTAEPIPAGIYRLTPVAAAHDALPNQEQMVEVPVYMGGQVTEISVTARRAPVDQTELTAPALICEEAGKSLYEDEQTYALTVRDSLAKKNTWPLTDYTLRIGGFELVDEAGALIQDQTHIAVTGITYEAGTSGYSLLAQPLNSQGQPYGDSVTVAAGEHAAIQAEALDVTYVNADGEKVVEAGFDGGSLLLSVTCEQRQPQLNAPQAGAVGLTAQALCKVVFDDVQGQRVLVGQSSLTAAQLPVDESFGVALELTADAEGQGEAVLLNTGSRTISNGVITAALPQGWQLLEAGEGARAVRMMSGDYLVFDEVNDLKPGAEKRVAVTLQAWNDQAEGTVYIGNVMGTEPVKTNPQGLLFPDVIGAFDPARNAVDCAAFTFVCRAQGSRGAQSAGNTLRGWLYEDENGSGVRDMGENGEAGLRVECEYNGVTLRAFTGSDGSFELPAMPPEGQALSCLLPDNMMTGAANDRMEIPYTVTCLIHGGVTVDGAPLQGVAVTAAGQKTVTDAAGEYRFSKLTAGTYEVTFDMTDELARRYAFEASGQSSMTVGQVTVTEAAKEAWVAAEATALGSITLEAQGMDGCGIRVEKDAQTICEGTVENGRCVMGQLYPGDYQIIAQLPNGMILDALNGYAYVQKGEARWTGSVAGGQDSLYRLSLAEQGRAQGTVVMSGSDMLTVTARGEYEAWSLETGTQIIFEGLIPGSYTLSAVLPQGYALAPDCAWTANGGEVNTIITVEAGETALVPELRLAGMGSVTGQVFEDQNANGLKDGEESARGQIKVNLCLAGEEASIQTTMTDENGRYSFVNVAPGEYYLTMEAPKGMAFNVIGGSVIAKDGRSDVFSVSDSQRLIDMNGTLVTPTGLKAVVFWDSNEDGNRGIYERAVSGITVSAVDQNGQIAATGVTDNEGQVVFKNLLSGVYRVRFDLPEGYAFSAKGSGFDESESAIGKQESRVADTEPMTLVNGRAASVGAGVLKLGFVSGKVWYDLDASGIMTNDEPGMAGITVKLNSRKASGVDYELVTDENGVYRFAGVRPGSYDLVVTAPDDMMFTRYSKTGRNMRSIFTGEGVRTGSKVLVVQSGRTEDNQNIGLVTGGVIEGIVFLDADYDGFYQPGDETLTGVSLELEKISTGDRVASATVGDDGAFRFEALRGGNYRLKAVLPDETVIFTHAVSANEQGNWFEAKANRQDSTLQRLELQDMEQKQVYVGVVRTGSISGSIYMDDNYSAARDGREATAYGLDVSLADEQGRVIARDTTGRDGSYLFKGLVPGQYQVRMEAKNGYVFTRRGEGNWVTSLSDAGDGATDMLALSMGAELTSIDGGLILPGKVSGLFFNDANDNGLQDAGENGLANVAVTLIDHQTGEAAFSLTTAEDGSYSFNRVMPGTYYVRYDLPEGGTFAQVVPGGNRLTGEGTTAASDIFNFKTADKKEMPLAGGLVLACIEGRVYEDINGSGSYDEGEPFQSGVQLVFDGNEQMTGENGAFLVDGVHPGSYALTFKCPEGYVFTRGGVAIAPRGQNAYEASYEAVSGLRLSDLMIGIVPEAKIIGFIWMDEDLSGSWNEMDTMLTGMEVTLVDTLDGETVCQTLTDMDGRFEFAGLVPGNYEAQIILPDACIAADAGYATFLDRGDGTLAQTDITVAAGETLEGLSAGIVQFTVLEGMTWQDEAGEALPLAGTRVELTDEDGNVIGSLVTGDDGRYSFRDVLPGDYFIKAELPEGYLLVNDQDDRVTSGLMMSIIEEDHRTHGVSYPLHVVMGAHESDLDIGAVKPGMLGDKAWLDENGNGLQETTEAPMPGVTIRLIKDGMVLHEAVTDVYGYYLFENVYPSAYDVEVLWHEELVPTKKRTDLELLASKLEESDETSQTLTNVEVRSNVKNFNFDLGFVLRKKGVEPETMVPAPKQVWN